ncbi:hypothetical protein P170DRAFT_425508 [Aspergillus steynii IBT 23096]|uniref:Uncharacterized protein n=1 Tax=Aspergillus steynii IBT 23096 TaxID=1392250 RepID=A0A2I2GEG4_9EURO|nr:uncharacterized protein P170DRAFT_425508 [Aspergillus steynii IBT 23096]PLB51260.1 hypothetical protein P170DRAFT_425508 [Aspergillus steynii IBT 23096]
MPSSSTTNPPTATLTPETLEHDLLTHLASTTALEDLHSNLLCSLQRTGWTEKIRRLSLELLRAGRCDRFDEVVEAVVASAEGRGHALWDAEGNAHAQSQSQSQSQNGSEDGVLDGSGGAGDAAVRNLDVRIPSEVVEQGVRAIKEVLREVVVLEDDGESNVGEGQGQGSNGTEKEREKDKDKEKEKGKHGAEKVKSKSELKNGDTSPVKKTEKKPKPGKQK